MWLRIEIDLSEIHTPLEALVVLREAADWIEKREDPLCPTSTGKILRNFESTPCGKMTIR